ncbi:unnamed protein product, partial [Bubo scandiacus]
KAAAPGHAPAAQPAGAASTCPKLPPLSAAPSAPSARGRQSWAIRCDRDIATSVEIWTPSPPSRAACATAVKETARCFVREVLEDVFTGSQGPCRQPAAQLDQTRRTGQALGQRTAKVQADDGSEALTAQPLPGPHPCGGTGAAGRAPAAASLGRKAGPGQLKQQEGEQQCVVSQRQSRRPGLRLRQVMPHTRVTEKETDHQEILLPLPRKAAAPRHAPASQPAGAASTCPKLPGPHPRASAKEEEEKDEILRGPSQARYVTILNTRVNAEPSQGRHIIWVNPFVLELFPDPHVDGPQDGPSRPSSTGIEAAGEAAGDLQSSSLTPAGPRDAEPAALAQEEAPSSPVLSERATAAEAVCQAPAPHSPTAYDTALQDTIQCLLSEFLAKVLAAPAAQLDQTRRTGQALGKRTAKVQADDGSEAPTAQPLRGPHPCGGTGAAGRAPAAASLGRKAGPGQLKQQEGEQQCVVSQRQSRRPSLRLRQVMPHTRVTEKETDHQEILLPLPRKAAAPRHAPASQPAGAASTCPKLPGPHPRASAKEEEEKDEILRGPSQARYVTILNTRVNAEPSQGRHIIWVNPFVLELFPDPHVDGPQDGPSRPSSTGIEAAGEAAGDLQSSSLTPAGPRDAEPAALAQEEAPSSPVLSERATAAEAVCQAPAPHSPTAYDTALQDTIQCLLRASAKEEEEKDEILRGPSQARYVTILNTQVNAEPSQGRHIIWVNPFVLELFPDPHVDGPQDGPSRPSSTGIEAAGEAAGDLQSSSPTPAGPRDAEPAALAQEEAPSSPVLSEQATAAEAVCQAPALHSPTAYDTALQDTIQCLLSEFLAKVLAAVQGLDQQPVEQRTLAQSVDDVTARTPVAPQVTEPPLAAEPLQEASTAPLKPPACEDGENAASPMSGAHQGEASTDIVSPAAHEDEVASPSPQNPPAEAGTPHLALTAHNKGDAVASRLSQDSGRRHGEYRDWPCPGQPSLGEALGVGGQAGACLLPALPCSCSFSSPAGIAALPHALARRRRPSLFRRALKALRTAFCCCTCSTGREED